MLAEKLRETVLSTKVIYENREISFTVSIGVATIFGNNNSNIEDVLKQADEALYKAKDKGRNCVVTVDFD